MKNTESSIRIKKENFLVELRKKESESFFISQRKKIPVSGDSDGSQVYQGSNRQLELFKNQYKMLQHGVREKDPVNVLISLRLIREAISSESDVSQTPISQFFQSDLFIFIMQVVGDPFFKNVMEIVNDECYPRFKKKKFNPQ